jgi:hypothetical protein
VTVRMMTLHCPAGFNGRGHDWRRPSQRGKPPRFCPDHAAKAAEKPVRAPKPPAVPDPYPVDLYPLRLYVDPNYVAPEPTDPEAIRRANIARAQRRIDQLESRLKLHGTHISQH